MAGEMRDNGGDGGPIHNKRRSGMQAAWPGTIKGQSPLLQTEGALCFPPRRGGASMLGQVPVCCMQARLLGGAAQTGQGRADVC